MLVRGLGLRLQLLLPLAQELLRHPADPRRRPAGLLHRALRRLGRGRPRHPPPSTTPRATAAPAVGYGYGTAVWGFSVRVEGRATTRARLSESSPETSASPPPPQSPATPSTRPQGGSGPRAPLPPGLGPVGGSAWAAPGRARQPPGPAGPPPPRPAGPRSSSSFRGREVFFAGRPVGLRMSKESDAAALVETHLLPFLPSVHPMHAHKSTHAMHMHVTAPSLLRVRGGRGPQEGRPLASQHLLLVFLLLLLPLL